MNTKAVVAGGIAGAALLVGGAVTAVQLSDSSTATTTINTALGAPNVRVVTVGSTEAIVDLGPSQPGPFTPSNAQTRSLKITWPRSQDNFHPTGITYKVYKNGKLINSTLVNNYITVGFTLAVRTFKFCVAAVNIAAMTSPMGCTTFTGH